MNLLKVELSELLYLRSLKVGFIRSEIRVATSVGVNLKLIFIWCVT